jgi:Uma2 family endonuclease
MSVSPSQPQADTYHGLLMGAEEYLALGETFERYELIHGVVCLMPRPSVLHQAVLAELIGQLGGFQRGECRFFASVDLVLARDIVYAPDIVAYRPGRLAGIPERLDTPPDLVIEILSYGTKAFDLTTKHNDYERFGVGEYWTYDPADKSARAFRRGGADLRFLMTSIREDELASEALAGFVLDLRPLRQLGA